ncbi:MULTISPECIES: hemolysin family protein [unclassified Sinorhizobium]|uniref:hemolysin family protein n=1 Tax=unclassified Sinorhizobium TaxID=2613772 RepID=UPI0024C25EB8|nr:MULTISPECIES: hemolysin family protein [unclassified Sinorhizobium]MDK1376998.1 hemolysin family protein [Sinorhizobium sp. 6-70]MDK1479321.1 hemolysin family protein [Sinorhizobium sp. 6-117]
MSDTNTQPAAVAAEEAEASGEAEAGSSSTATPRQEGSKSTTSFWSRAARLLRGASPSSLREDLADALMTDADSNAAFSPEERAMLNNILRFREVRVEDVMVPRADIEAVDQSITIGELMVIFEESGRSRMPVYNEGLDDPRGMIHIRDLLAYVTKQARNRRRNGKAQPTPLTGAEKTPRQQRVGFDFSRVDLGKTVEEAGIVRQVLFVPPSMLASDLMQRMQAARIQMALVIDEYGGTDGLVSLEDIVEMVVGDIEDEHDDEEVMFARSSDDVFVADARVELEEIAEAIGPDFDVREQLEDVDTLGGLVFASLGRIPVRGEVVQAIPGFEFQILDADPRRVKRVRIMRKRPLARRRVVKTERETSSETPPAGRDTEAGAGSQPASEQ